MSDWDESSSEQRVTLYERQHDTGEETRVVCVDVGGTFLVIAVDVDEVGEVIDAQLVDDTLTVDEAEQRAERWAENNPKGLKGDGVLPSIFG